METLSPDIHPEDDLYKEMNDLYFLAIGKFLAKTMMNTHNVPEKVIAEQLIDYKNEVETYLQGMKYAS